MKEIAKALQISPRTVETYIEQIKNKTNCLNRSEIVDYALSKGYLNYIPQRFLSNEISTILY